MSAMNKVLWAAITLILGAVLIGVIADMSYDTAQLKGVTNEVVDLSTARVGSSQMNSTINISLANAYPYGGYRTGESTCDISAQTFSLSNSTNRSLTSFTKTTDYTISARGVLNLQNTTATSGSLSNTTYASYNYCTTNYITSSWGRSVMQITIGLFAILLLGIAVAFMYSAYTEIK